MKKGFVILISAILLILLIMVAFYVAVHGSLEDDVQPSSSVPLVTVDDTISSSADMSKSSEEQIRQYDKQSAKELLLKDEELCTYTDITNLDSIVLEDITTNDIYTKARAQIFKTANEYESFIISGDSMYHIGKANGAFGISYMDICDFDDNGIMDVIYVYSYQDDAFTVEIAYFDMTLKTENVMYRYESSQYNELILEKQSDGLFDVYTTIADNTGDEDISFIKDQKIAEITAISALDYASEYGGTEWVE